MSYIGNSPGVASQRVETAFTATSNQTAFTPSSGYTLGYCDVYQNGVKLVNGDDYTASDGVTVTLATGAASGDSIVIVASFPRGLSDGYLKSEADAKYVALTGDQTVAGVKTLSGNPILSGGTANGVAYLNGSKVVTSGSALVFDGTNLGVGGAAESGSQIRTYNGSGHGKITIETTDSYASFINYSAATSEFSAGFVKSDSSFRFCAYGDLTTNERARITSTGGLSVGTTNDPGAGNINLPNGKFIGWGNLESLIYGDSSSNYIYFRTSGAEKARITSGGNLLVGTTTATGFLSLVTAQSTAANDTTTGSIFSALSPTSGILMRNRGNSAGIGGAAYSTQLFTDSGAGNFEIYNIAAAYSLIFGTAATERARITSSGILRLALSQLQLSGGDVGIVVANGNANINSTYSVTFNAASQSSLFVFAAHNHYGLIAGYGCSRLSACSVGAGGGSENNIHNATSANGGSWTFSPYTSSITVTHNAGSYGANGLYTIIVIGNGVSV